MVENQQPGARPNAAVEFARFSEGLWVIVGLALLAGVASIPLGVKYFRSLPESVPISLTISEDNSQHGNAIYMRQTGDVLIRLEVQNAKGQKTQEVVRFIGPHPLVGGNHTPITTAAAETLRTETTPLLVSKAPPGEQAPATSEAPKSKQTAPGSSSAGPSGTYLQLVATSKLEAEIMVDRLRRKRFESLAEEIPGKAGTYGVLVGPVRDGNVNKLRADLQDAGFPGNRAIRRTY